MGVLRLHACGLLNFNYLAEHCTKADATLPLLLARAFQPTGDVHALRTPVCRYAIQIVTSAGGVLNQLTRLGL